MPAQLQTALRDCAGLREITYRGRPLCLPSCRRPQETAQAFAKSPIGAGPCACPVADGPKRLRRPSPARDGTKRQCPGPEVDSFALYVASLLPSRGDAVAWATRPSVFIIMLRTIPIPPGGIGFPRSNFGIGAKHNRRFPRRAWAQPSEAKRRGMWFRDRLRLRNR